MKSNLKSSFPLYGLTVRVIILLFLFAPGSYANRYSSTSPIHADAHVDTVALTVGDVLTFTVSITADSDIQPDPIDFNKYFTGFDVIANGVKKPEKINSQIRTEHWYRLRADEVGEYKIPPVLITFTAPDPKYPDKTLQGQILTPEVKIEILSVLGLQGKPKNIRDIKPILEIAPDWHRYALYGLLVFSTLAILLIWAYKKAAPLGPKPIKAVPLLPHEQAIQELNALQTKKLLPKGLFREHYFELSQIFRRYLGNRFSVPALDWTSTEIKVWLKSGHGLIHPLGDLVENILEQTDQVKFAKVEPSRLVSDKIMSSIFQLIDATKKVTRPIELQHQNVL